MGTSQWAVYAGFRGSKSSFYFLLCAHAEASLRGKKTKQEKRAPATKPTFPSKHAIQPCRPLCTQASNVPPCS